MFIILIGITGVMPYETIVLAVGTLPEYLQSGGDATQTLGRFMSGALNFLTSFLWGIWALFAVLFAKDLMVGKDAEDIKGPSVQIGRSGIGTTDDNDITGIVCRFRRLKGRQMAAYNGRLLPRYLFGIPLPAVTLAATAFLLVVVLLLPVRM